MFFLTCLRFLVLLHNFRNEVHRKRFTGTRLNEIMHAPIMRFLDKGNLRSSEQFFETNAHFPSPPHDANCAIVVRRDKMTNGFQGLFRGWTATWIQQGNGPGHSALCHAGRSAVGSSVGRRRSSQSHGCFPSLIHAAVSLPDPKQMCFLLRLWTAWILSPPSCSARLNLTLACFRLPRQQASAAVTREGCE